MELIDFLKTVESGRRIFTIGDMGATAFNAALETARAAAEHGLISVLYEQHESQTGQRLKDRFTVQDISAEGRLVLKGKGNLCA